MGRIKKKGESGNAVKYMGRNKALKKLQISLKAFRRLCILKGIYPREPPTSVKKAKGQNKTYYLTKDILWLMHDPLLNTMRDEKAHLKKIGKAKGRNEYAEMRRLLRAKPRPELDKVIQARYPTFMDALRDLDDALSTVGLFAQLPAGAGLMNTRTKLCKRLMAEWQFYVSANRLLEKVFVSIRGTYFQARVEGVLVTWLIPHSFTTKWPPPDVDSSVMMNFLELYEALLGFVNYHLITKCGMKYPPPKTLLFAHRLALPEDKRVPEAELTGRRNLFKNLHFLLGRETHAENLRFIVECLGGRVTSEEETDAEVANLSHVTDDVIARKRARLANATVTHHICDRPKVPDDMQFPNREYVQPQWVFDCVNAGVLLPISDYAVGAKLPPHLSPFVDEANQSYEPERAKQIRAFIEQATASSSASSASASQSGDGDEGGEEEEQEGDVKVERVKVSEDVFDTDRVDPKLARQEEEYQRDLDEERGVENSSTNENTNNSKNIASSKLNKKQQKKSASSAASVASVSSSSKKRLKEEKIAQDEEEKEAEDEINNNNDKKKNNNKEENSSDENDDEYEVVRKPARQLTASEEAQETEDLQATLLPKKKRRLYQRIRFTQKKNTEEADELIEKRRKIAEHEKQLQALESSQEPTQKKKKKDSGAVVVNPVSPLVAMFDRQKEAEKAKKKKAKELRLKQQQQEEKKKNANNIDNNNTQKKHKNVNSEAAAAASSSSSKKPITQSDQNPNTNSTNTQQKSKRPLNEQTSAENEAHAPQQQQQTPQKKAKKQQQQQQQQQQ